MRTTHVHSVDTPRGRDIEVGLIFAQLGLSVGLLSSGLYSRGGAMHVVIITIRATVLRSQLEKPSRRIFRSHAIDILLSRCYSYV